jgi:hypothetical protein
VHLRATPDNFYPGWDVEPGTTEVILLSRCSASKLAPRAIEAERHRKDTARTVKDGSKTGETSVGVAAVRGRSIPLSPDGDGPLE